MSKIQQANILIDRSDVLISNILALTESEKSAFKVPTIDIVVSLETTLDLLRRAQDILVNQ